MCLGSLSFWKKRISYPLFLLLLFFLFVSSKQMNYHRAKSSWGSFAVSRFWLAFSAMSSSLWSFRLNLILILDHIKNNKAKLLKNIYLFYKESPCLTSCLLQIVSSSTCLTVYINRILDQGPLMLIINCSSLTEMKMFNRFSRVGSCGMSFCTTLLKASKMEWS